MIIINIYNIQLKIGEFKFMTVKINYNVSPSKKNLDNQVVFVDDNFNISGLKTHISRNEFSYIYDLININDKKKNIITFDISSKKKNNFSID